MHKELKRQIINWLFDNEKQFQLVNSCSNEFKQYIYLPNGEFRIGGEDVLNFIRNAEKLIYSEKLL